MENPVLIAVVAVVLTTTVFALGFFTVNAIYRGAVIFFRWASEQGFVGIAVFAACWFLMLPVTLIACAVVGFSPTWAVRERDRAAREIARQRLGLDL